MKRYVIQIVIEEGYDEYWESINTSGKTGCDDIHSVISELVSQNFDASVKIVEFTDKE